MSRARLTILVIFASLSGLLLVWSLTPLATARFEEDEGIDPDRPPGVEGPFDEGEYKRQREAFVALLRGIDPNKPFDPEARTRANTLMDGQVAALRRAVEESSGATVPLALVFLTLWPIRRWSCATATERSCSRATTGRITRRKRRN